MAQYPPRKPAVAFPAFTFHLFTESKPKASKVHPASPVSSSPGGSQLTSPTSSTASSPRAGGEESYNITNNVRHFVHRLASVRTYRVVTYVEEPETGMRVVTDILTGQVYFTGVGRERKITKNAIVYDSQRAALGERFPHNQIGPSKSGNGRLPRLLASFDAWGHSQRRLGGGGAAKYEFVKFVGVVRFLDSPTTYPRAQTDKAVEPYNFARRDSKPPLRLTSRRGLKTRDEKLMNIVV